ncbi:zinc-binding dehydrogenase [Streptomyces sp. LBUM 1476]|nr:zinc-binding dehydrogenase [Streptomyces sp. LBUM 1476]
MLGGVLPLRHLRRVPARLPPPVHGPPQPQPRGVAGLLRPVRPAAPQHDPPPPARHRPGRGRAGGAAVHRAARGAPRRCGRRAHGRRPRVRHDRAELPAGRPAGRVRRGRLRGRRAREGPARRGGGRGGVRRRPDRIALPAEVGELIVRQLGGERPEVVFVSAGYPGVLDQAVAAVRPGGTVVVVSYFEGPVLTDLNALVGREARVLFSSLSVPDDFRRVISWLADGTLDPLPLVTHHFPLDDIEEAMSVLDRPAAATGKVMLRIGGAA